MQGVRLCIPLEGGSEIHLGWGAGCSFQGSSPEIHIGRKCFQCGGWECGSNVWEQRKRQLACMADPLMRPSGGGGGGERWHK